MPSVARGIFKDEFEKNYYWIKIPLKKIEFCLAMGFLGTTVWIAVANIHTNIYELRALLYIIIIIIIIIIMM